MIIPSILSLLLAAASAQDIDPSDPKSVDAMMCGPATEIFLPDPQRLLSPNVRLEHLQFMSPDDPCGRNFKHEEVTQLQEQVKKIAVNSFAGSQSSFGVMVQYTLAPGSPAVFEMRVMDAPATEQQRLTAFHDGAKALKVFTPTGAIVHVAIQYAVSPAPVVRAGGG